MEVFFRPTWHGAAYPRGWALPRVWGHQRPGPPTQTWPGPWWPGRCLTQIQHRVLCVSVSFVSAGFNTCEIKERGVWGHGGPFNVIFTNLLIEQ